MVVTEILPSDTYRIPHLEPSNGRLYSTTAHVSQLKAWRSWNEDDDDSSENSDDEPGIAKTQTNCAKTSALWRMVPAAALAGYQDLSDFERGFIIGAREMGHSISEVSMKFGFTPTTILLMYREYRVSDMNIIEDIWDALLHVVEKRSPPPRTSMDLLTALQDSWCEFPPGPGYFQTLVESMPRRFASLLPT
ncbi:hypothetical protein AVEN_215558-1 [Araneus ventricosus]|uniref:Tc3 transposase DNA binding domain-containing protein n=1 Tax=Araneus ventricosus TaxID=182803 RepID=A0A4Y2BHR5_ARAVE|nr:hypothetical protein AVEN_215558-1 [Araneus ventricosus]